MINTLYDKFKPWSDGGSVFIISDTHFEDSAPKLMDPNWITSEEQVEIIRKYVHKNDTLIHLGDVGNPTWMQRIPGYKVLIMGNHCAGKKNYTLYFDEVYEGCLFIAEKILLSHEPVIVDYALNIHGHDHSGKSYPYDKYPDYHHVNLAANLCNYTPVNLKDIINTGVLKQIKSIHRRTIDEATERKCCRQLNEL